MVTALTETQPFWMSTLAGTTCFHVQHQKHRTLLLNGFLNNAGFLLWCCVCDVYFFSPIRHLWHMDKLGSGKYDVVGLWFVFQLHSSSLIVGVYF